LGREKGGKKGGPGTRGNRGEIFGCRKLRILEAKKTSQFRKKKKEKKGKRVGEVVAEDTKKASRGGGKKKTGGGGV